VTRRLLAVATAVVLGYALAVALSRPAALLGRAHPAPPDYERIVREEAGWIIAAQLSCAGDGDGAIAEARITGPGPVSVHPYEANIAARGLLAAGPDTVPAVRRYLQWYLQHLNRPDRSGVVGTVYDYDYDPVRCSGTPQRHPVTGERPKYDSTDAYAGTFLTLVTAYAQAAPGDRDLLRSPAVRVDLDAVADVVGATRRPSGLSGATPIYPAEYLMDNVEAQRGIADYAWLLQEVLGDPAAGQRRAAQAAGIRDAIEARLWQGSRTAGMYGWAADQLSPSGERWFPDSVAQLWPVLDGLGPAGRRAQAWAAFDRRWPAWRRSTPAYGAVAAEHDPNAAAGYAAARMGDRNAVDDYLRSSQRYWADAGRPPPWTVDDAGFRALAARAMTTPTRTR
jgi:hypothetical protein